MDFATIKAAVEARRQHPNTPYKVEAFAKYFKRFPALQRKHPELLDGLRHGFDLGLPPVTRTVAPPNGRSVDKYIEGYNAIIRNEFEKGRYLGPLTRRQVREILGSEFHSSPVSLKPKSTPGKYRAIHDFSRGEQSINMQVDPSEFPSTWTTFDVVSRIIITLPQGSQASIRDVSEAYRTVPARPDQWPALVVRLQGEDSFAININNNFGLASAGGVYATVADAGLDIFRAAGIGPVARFVDDHIFFRIPKKHLAAYNRDRQDWKEKIKANGGKRDESGKIYYSTGVTGDYRPEAFAEDCTTPLQDLSSSSKRGPRDAPFAYNSADIDRVSAELGYPWEPSKTIEFADEVPFIGWDWNLSTKEVAFRNDKKQAYLEEVQECLRRLSTITKEDASQLRGRLEHACQVLGPEGRAYLVSLEDIGNCLAAGRALPPSLVSSLREDLQWWVNVFSQPRIARKLRGVINFEPIDVHCGLNARSTYIVVVVGDQRRSWTLLSGRNGQGKIVGDAAAFEMATLAVFKKLTNSPPTSNMRYVRIYTTNNAIANGWAKGNSKDQAVNSIFREIHRMAREKVVQFHLVPAPPHESPVNTSSGINLPRIPIPTHLGSVITETPCPTPASTTPQPPNRPVAPRAAKPQASPPDPTSSTKKTASNANAALGPSWALGAVAQAAVRLFQTVNHPDTPPKAQPCRPPPKVLPTRPTTQQAVQANAKPQTPRRAQSPPSRTSSSSSTSSASTATTSTLVSTINQSKYYENKSPPPPPRQQQQQQQQRAPRRQSPPSNGLNLVRVQRAPGARTRGTQRPPGVLKPPNARIPGGSPAQASKETKKPSPEPPKVQKQDEDSGCVIQ